MGPWHMGRWYKVVGVLTVLSMVVVIGLSIQPPNDRALPISVALLALAGVVWFGWERKRFKGPPDMSKWL
jgi:uncharacterized membrane protein